MNFRELLRIIYEFCMHCDGLGRGCQKIAFSFRELIDLEGLWGGEGIPALPWGRPVGFQRPAFFARPASSFRPWSQRQRESHRLRTPFRLT